MIKENTLSISKKNRGFADGWDVDPDRDLDFDD